VEIIAALLTFVSLCDRALEQSAEIGAPYCSFTQVVSAPPLELFSPQSTKLVSLNYKANSSWRLISATDWFHIRNNAR